MRNPNGFGTVARLSGNRRRPYIIKKTVGWKDNGQPIFDIIGYAATKEEGIMLLAQYNADPWNVDQAKTTLQGLFDLWKEKKAPKLGTSNRSSLLSAYNHCLKLKDKPYKQIKAYQMQETIDSCGKGYSTQAAIKNLWGHLDSFAFELDIISKKYSEVLTSDPIPPTNRVPFSKAEIETLWDHASEPWVDSVLIFIYSGWRISEMMKLGPDNIDLEQGTMTSGVKTAAGKNRIVPIHSLIRPFIESRLAEGGSRLLSYDGKPLSETKYREFWGETMARYGMNHVPHEARHTLESMLDEAKANRKCIDMIMGHVSKDVGNRVYNHKTIEELRLNLELVTR